MGKSQAIVQDLASRRCGVVSPSAERARALRAQTVQFRQRENVVEFLEADMTVNLSVYFHIITSTTGEGALTNDDVAEQMRVLNACFNAHGFYFSLVGVTRSINDSWYRMRAGSDEEKVAKRRLAVDPRQHLNIYSCLPRDENGVGVFGFATMPHDAGYFGIVDGVTLDWHTAPGQGGGDYGLGHTAVHEVGHWLGLHHTFAPSDAGDGRTGCDVPGDEVDDTPAQASANWSECIPGKRDTCEAPGYDPIDNFMDYSRDACMLRFTAGQAARMREQTALYRRTVGVKSAVFPFRAEAL